MVTAIATPVKDINDVKFEADYNGYTWEVMEIDWDNQTVILHRFGQPKMALYNDFMITPSITIDADYDDLEAVRVLI